MTAMQPLLTPKQTAEMLGLSESALNAWRCSRDNPLPYVKVGGGRLVRYRLEDVTSHIEINLKGMKTDAATPTE